PEFDLDLLMAGRTGDRANALLTRVGESPLLTRRVRWVGEVSDTKLDELYRDCHMLLYPRLEDSWGLPIPEALSHGRLVICSDRPVNREASCGRAVFLDPLDRRGWTAAIRGAAAGARVERDGVGPTTWDTAAASVRTGLLSVLDRAHVALM